MTIPLICLLGIKAVKVLTRKSLKLITTSLFSYSLSKQNGRSHIGFAKQTCSYPLGMASLQENHSSSKAHSGSTECHSRSRVTRKARCSKLEAWFLLSVWHSSSVLNSGECLLLSPFQLDHSANAWRSNLLIVWPVCLLQLWCPTFDRC